MQIAAQLDRFIPRSTIYSRVYLLMVLAMLPLFVLFFIANRFVNAFRSR
jgi:hypothetical protein